MIAIVDYGLGNVKAIANIYKNLDLPILWATQVEELERASKIILPGVGAFDQAIKCLETSGLRSTLDHMVLNLRLPVLGICVGMQMFAHSSEEGTSSGLGWIDARVKRFDFSSFDKSLCIPHMGWNNIRPVNKSPLLHQLDENSRFYFLHSYYFSCKNTEDIIAVTGYGSDFACAINTANIYGVQFHPEKSHQSGIQLLKNFADL